jgi:3-oxoadipate enol-lactonase
VPPGFIANLPGRGEVFFRHHDNGAMKTPPLLLLHGWTASADLQWFTAYQELAERYSFIAIDHRGHGRGMRSLEPFTLEAAADDAAALVELLGAGPVLVAGYSMGGPIALHLWHRHPQLVAGLILEATALEWRDRIHERLRYRLLSIMEVGFRSRWARRMSVRLLARMARQYGDVEPWVPWIGAEMARGEPSALIEAARALGRYDARPFAPGVNVPTAVVLTTKDTLVDPRRQKALADATHATVYQLAGDHLAFVVMGQAFSQVTRAAVDDVAARVASG